MNKTIKWIIIISIIVILIGGGIFWYLIQNLKTEIPKFDEPKKDPIEVLEEADVDQNPDVANIMEYYSLTDDEKNMLSADYLLVIINSLKKAFFEKRAMVKVVEISKKALEKAYDPVTKAKIYAILGNVFCDGVRAPEIAEELYKGDDEFPEILKKANGDYSLAGRMIFEKSYELNPTPRVANMISHWYAKQILVGNDKEKWPEYSKKMHKYMTYFEKEKPRPNGLMDFSYYWAAMSYGAFCKMGEKEYCKKNREAINFYIHPEPQYSGTWAVLFSAYYYLTLDNDKERAEREIKNHQETFNNDQMSLGVQMLWNNEIKRNVNHDLMYQVIDDLRKISPELDKWIKKVESRDPINPYKLIKTSSSYKDVLKNAEEAEKKIYGTK